MQTWPEMDHFQRTALPPDQRRWGPSTSIQTRMAPKWPQGNSPEILACLKTLHTDHVRVLVALANLGCRTVGYMPEAASGKPAPMAHPVRGYAAGPVNLDLALRGAKLCLCHAGKGTVGRGASVHGSAQGEQFLMARFIEHVGLGTNALARLRPLDYDALMPPSRRDGPIPNPAPAFATKYSGFSPAQQAVKLVYAFERLARHHSHTGLPR